MKLEGKSGDWRHFGFEFEVVLYPNSKAEGNLRSPQDVLFGGTSAYCSGSGGSGSFGEDDLRDTYY